MADATAAAHRGDQFARRCIRLSGLALFALFFFASSASEAAGCLSGGAVGGVVGHEVGSGHSVAGAAAGCAIGHHEASKKEKQQQSSNGNQGDKRQISGSGSSEPDSDRNKQ